MRHLCLVPSAEDWELRFYICSLLPDVSAPQGPEITDNVCVLAWGDLRHSCRGERGFGRACAYARARVCMCLCMC